MTGRTATFWIGVCFLAGPAMLHAETHRFTPTQFYNTWSAAHPPALRIKPGDRVVTKTIDAAGVDWNGKTAGVGPNPQTGPFYMKALSWATLVVTLEKLETNRAMAYSASLLSPYATTPQAIGARTDREAKRLTWTIDKAKGVARRPSWARRRSTRSPTLSIQALL